MSKISDIPPPDEGGRLLPPIKPKGELLTGESYRKIEVGWESSVTLLIKSIWYQCVSWLAVPFSRKAAKAFDWKSAHQDLKLSLMSHKKQFGEAIIGKARNIAAVSVIETDADQKASKKLLDACKKFADQQRIRFHVAKDATAERVGKMGNCIGKVHDDAVKYLLEDKSPEEIVKANETGVSGEAAANQVVLVLLNRFFSSEGKINAALSELQRHAESKEKNVYTEVARALATLSGQRLNEDSPFSLFFKQCLKEARENPDFTPFLHFEWQALEGIKDVSAFVAYCHNKLPLYAGDQKEAEKAIRLIGSCLEYKQASISKKEKKPEPEVKHDWVSKLKAYATELFGSGPPKRDSTVNKITDADNREMIVSAMKRMEDLSLNNLVANARGLQVAVPELYDTLSQVSDSDFIGKLDQLEPGFYNISFDTISGGHAITYIKKEDGSCYILDPNRPQLRAGSDEEAKKLFTTLLDTYSLPEKGGGQHNLRILQFSKK